MAQTNDKGERRWRPVDPLRHHREKGWDYRGRAIYHFTLPVEGRYPLGGKATLSTRWQSGCLIVRPLRTINSRRAMFVGNRRIYDRIVEKRSTEH